MPVYQGAYFSQTFIIKSQATGLAVDVTGWTFRVQVRDNVADATSLLELTTANGGFVVTNGPAGQVTLKITAAQATALPVGKMHFDVMRTDVNPGPTRLFGGTFKVKQPVTR